MRDAEYPSETPLADGYFAEAQLPLGKTRRLTELPFAEAMTRSGLGRLTSAAVEAGAGRRWLVLRFSLFCEGRAALDALAALLRGLGAPPETRIGHAECPGALRIGAVRALPGLVALSAVGAPKSPADGAAGMRPFCRQTRKLMRDALLSAGAPAQPAPRRLH